MKRQRGSVFLIALSMAVGLCLAAGTAVADDIAWDMVNSTSQNLNSFSTDAPAFSSPGDGFQKYTVGLSPSIPYALVDDSAGVYPPDTLGVIDSSTDFDEFFGATDTVNDDNLAGDPYHATWVFDISAAVAPVELWIDLAAMGNFEPEDTFYWTYQVDFDPAVNFLNGVADEAGSMSYVLANGTTVSEDDPLVVDGVPLSNVFTSFATPIPSGTFLTVTLTAVTDGTYECYAARNIVVRDGSGGAAAQAPVPTLSWQGITVMVLLLLAGGMLLIRRLH
jgi:hypothetical protein